MTHAEIFEPNDKITHQQRLTRIRVNIILLMKSNTKGKYRTKEENVNIIAHATHQKIVATYQKQETRLEREVFFFFTWWKSLTDTSPPMAGVRLCGACTH